MLKYCTDHFGGHGRCLIRVVPDERKLRRLSEVCKMFESLTLRRNSILKSHLAKFGYTKDCPRCVVIKKNGDWPTRKRDRTQARSCARGSSSSLFGACEQWEEQRPCKYYLTLLSLCVCARVCCLVRSVGLVPGRFLCCARVCVCVRVCVRMCLRVRA